MTLEEALSWGHTIYVTHSQFDEGVYLATLKLRNTRTGPIGRGDTPELAVADLRTSLREFRGEFTLRKAGKA